MALSENIKTTATASALSVIVALMTALAATSSGQEAGITQEQLNQLNADATVWVQQRTELEYHSSTGYQAERLTANIARNDALLSTEQSAFDAITVPTLSFDEFLDDEELEENEDLTDEEKAEKEDRNVIRDQKEAIGNKIDLLQKNRDKWDVTLKSL